MILIRCTTTYTLPICLFALLGVYSPQARAQYSIPCEPPPQAMPYCEPVAPPEPPAFGTAPPPMQAAAQEEPATPAVAIHVRVPANGTTGQDLEYRIIVENTSQAAAHHVILRDPLPATARFVS